LKFGSTSALYRISKRDIHISSKKKEIMIIRLMREKKKDRGVKKNSSRT